MKSSRPTWGTVFLWGLMAFIIYSRIQSGLAIQDQQRKLREQKFSDLFHLERTELFDWQLYHAIHRPIGAEHILGSPKTTSDRNQ